MKAIFWVKQCEMKSMVKLQPSIFVYPTVNVMGRPCVTCVIHNQLISTKHTLLQLIIIPRSLIIYDYIYLMHTMLYNTMGNKICSFQFWDPCLRRSLDQILTWMHVTTDLNKIIPDKWQWEIAFFLWFLLDV